MLLLALLLPWWLWLWMRPDIGRAEGAGALPRPPRSEEVVVLGPPAAEAVVVVMTVPFEGARRPPPVPTTMAAEAGEPAALALPMYSSRKLS